MSPYQLVYTTVTGHILMSCIFYYVTDIINKIYLPLKCLDARYYSEQKINNLGYVQRNSW
jgi:hypothetical protein